jgi:hypothetical protein
VSKKKPQAWVWEDGSIGVRRASTLEEARVAVREQVDPDEQSLADEDPEIYAVPAAYFSDNWSDRPWDMSHVYRIKETDESRRGFSKVFWWTAYPKWDIRSVAI